MWHNYLTAGTGLGTAVAANGAYNKWLKNPIQNSINKDLIDKLELDIYNGKLNTNTPGLSSSAKKSWVDRVAQDVATLNRLKEHGMLGAATTPGLTRSGKIGKAGAAGTGLLATWLLDNFVL